jgi:hypothetical protein
MPSKKTKSHPRGRNARPLRQPRIKTQDSIYRFNRTMNLSNAVGTAVDAVVLTKSGANLIVYSSAGALTLQYGVLTSYFQLSDLSSYQDFTGLFDQYRVDKITVRIFPYCTGATTGAAYSSGSGQTGVLLHDVVDYDDVIAPTGSDAGVQALREYQNYRCSNLLLGGQPITRTFVPRIAVGAYSSGVFTGYKNDPFDWSDCASPNIQGFGYKAIMEVCSSGVALGLMVKAEAELSLSFRNVH